MPARCFNGRVTAKHLSFAESATSVRDERTTGSYSVFHRLADHSWRAL